MASDEFFSWLSVMLAFRISEDNCYGATFWHPPQETHLQPIVWYCGRTSTLVDAFIFSKVGWHGGIASGRGFTLRNPDAKRGIFSTSDVQTDTLHKFTGFLNVQGSL